MLKAITIRDFQAHRKLTVPLSDTVTTIVGPSDVGKSAIIRALRWVAFNRPVGTAFIRDGADRAEVTVECDGHEIVRGKGKGGNHYIIDGLALGALGNDVPTRVQEILSLSEENFQAQHDAPFWFSETAGEVSRRLNAIVQLDIMDCVLAELVSRLRQQRDLLGLIEGRIKAIEEERRGLRYVARVGEVLSVAECAAAKEQQATENVQALGALCEDVVDLQTAALVSVGINRLAENARVAVDAWAECSRGVDALARLVDGLVGYATVLSRPAPDMKPLLNAHALWHEATGGASALEEDLDRLLELRIELGRLRDSLARMQTEFTSQMGAVCQLCGQKIR